MNGNECEGDQAQLFENIRQYYQARFASWSSNIHDKLSRLTEPKPPFNRYHINLRSSRRMQLLLDDPTWKSLCSQVDEIVGALPSNGAEPLTGDETLFIRDLREMFHDVRNAPCEDGTADYRSVVTEVCNSNCSRSYYHDLAHAFHYQVTRSKSKERFATFFFYSTLIVTEEQKMPQVGHESRS